MILALYWFVAKVVLPQLGAFASASIEPLMLVVITLAGIVMLLGAAGMRISNNLGATIANGIFGAIGYLVRTMFQAIGWIIRNTLRLIPRVFTESRRTFAQMGMGTVASNVCALLVTLVVTAVII